MSTSLFGKNTTCSEKASPIFANLPTLPRQTRICPTTRTFARDTLSQNAKSGPQQLGAALSIGRGWEDSGGQTVYHADIVNIQRSLDRAGFIPQGDGIEDRFGTGVGHREGVGESRIGGVVLQSSKRRRNFPPVRRAGQSQQLLG